MDFKTLERLWASNENNLSKAAEAYVLEEAMKTLARRRSASANTLWLVGFGLIVWTIAVAYAVMAAKIDVRREWGVFLMLGVSWAAFFRVQAQHRRHMGAYPGTGASMLETLQALRDENHVRQRRAKLLAVASAVFCGTIAVALWQLHAVGKMTSRDVLQGSIVFGGAMLVSATVQAVVHFGFTRPEGERLKRLLRDYET
ncbi:MAG TPA: hypothetical protein VG839_09980 [Asticcacaulis sp.]|nr:hypothetical protein [Asticcacaulis sp.]